MFRQKVSKHKTIKKHAKERAGERFGIIFDQKTHDEVIKIIQDGKAKFVERQSNRITLFDVFIDGKECRVVYDKERKTIVTFLNKDYKNSLFYILDNL